MQQSIVKFIALSYRHCSTCFGHYFAHHQEPVKLSLQLLVSVWMWLRTLPPPHSYGNQRLQRQFDGLLMMGIVMPETCWAVSVRQSNKFYDWLLHVVGCFYLSDWRCTEPQTLNYLSLLAICAEKRCNSSALTIHHHLHFIAIRRPLQFIERR